MADENWQWNPKRQGSGFITCIPQTGRCPNECADCFFQSGRSYLEPLEENLPHIPSPDMARGRIVLMNDGNDSNVNRQLVEKTAKQFERVFFNTAIPKELDAFPGPVVLTINPGKDTDTKYTQLDEIPKNLMFVRVRVNLWNIRQVVNPAVCYYTALGCPVVLTFMAYYETPIPDRYKQFYEWKERTLNPYWVMKHKTRTFVENLYARNELVYSCGYKDSHSCMRCGNCIREYHNTMERMRNDGT